LVRESWKGKQAEKGRKGEWRGAKNRFVGIENLGEIALGHLRDEDLW
jgi:hypothetical protein